MEYVPGWTWWSDLKLAVILLVVLVLCVPLVIWDFILGGCDETIC